MDFTARLDLEPYQLVEQKILVAQLANPNAKMHYGLVDVLRPGKVSAADKGLDF